MVATYNSSGDFTIDFTPNPDAIPPQNIEIEESVLGGILLDFACIHRIKSRLKPEHFFLNSHRQIYKACLAIAKKGLPTDLLQVTAYLIDKKLLQDIGGKNKLVDLLNSTVSAVNIDALANVLIQKHARRELIKLGNDVTQFAYSSEIELEDVLDLVRRRTETAVSSDASKTQDELIKSRHDSLIEKLKIIYTTTVEPSLKYLKLKYLADETRTSISFLENLYLKALVGTCTQLMDYSDLKESAGSSVRRWLQQGLIPLASTILLAADGGVGKTKFVYSVAKNLIAGHDFGDFLATGEKRKILFYQGDEQPGDMLQSLQMLGYEEGDINQYIRVRFGWSFENMATLIKDLNEFKPDFVLFDSMSFGQRFSSYKEGDSEFARPILECTGLAVEHNCTFLFIHHTNKGGDVRGTTATRNAVSEVWRLRKDSRPEATQYDRILEIDKSRSRSSGKNYRLYFDPDTLGFNFLGEDIQADEDKETGIKKSLLTYFKTHPNVKYTSEELSHFLKISRNSIRRTLNTLSSDGMVSVERKPGKAYLYYLEFTGEKPSGGDHTDCMVTPLITSVDHLQEIDIASDTAKPDQVITENALSNFKSEIENPEKTGSPDHLCSNDLSSKDSRGDQLGDQLGDQGCDHTPCLDDEPGTEVVQVVQQALIPEIEKPSLPEENLSRMAVKHITCVGEIKAIAQQLDAKQWRISFTPNIEGFVGDVVVTEKIGKSKPETRIRHHIDEWLRSLNFQVYKANATPAQWVEAKWCESGEHYEPMRKCHTFVDVDGQLIKISGHGRDRIRVVRKC